MAITKAQVDAILASYVDLVTDHTYLYGHQISQAKIAAITDSCVAFHNEYWSDGVLTDKEALVIQVAVLDTLLELMGLHVLSQLMQSGVTYSTLQLSVTKGGTFTEQTKENIQALTLRRDRFIRMLQDSAEVDANTDLGQDYWTNGLDKYDVDDTPT